MSDLTDKELDDLRTADVYDEQCERAYDEIRRHRAAMRRLDTLETTLRSHKRDPGSMEHYWAAELRAALTGRKFLYRCPEHGDRSLLSQRHERGVCCGKPLIIWEERIGGSCCSRTAELVGEVDVDAHALRSTPARFVCDVCHRDIPGPLGADCPLEHWWWRAGHAVAAPEIKP